MQGVAREILSSRMVVIDAGLPIERAEALLLSHQAEELFVTDGEGRLLGVVSDYAILKWRLLPAGEESVDQIMSTNVPTASPDAPLVEVAARLRMHVHGRIPIVEEGRLVGVVTRRALLQRLAAAGDSHSEPRDAALPKTLSAPNFLKSSRAGAGTFAAAAERL